MKKLVILLATVIISMTMSFSAYAQNARIHQHKHHVHRGHHAGWHHHHHHKHRHHHRHHRSWHRGHR